MLFTSLVFPVFFGVVLAAYWGSRSRTPQNLLLLAASLFFYAYGEPRLLSVLLVCSLTGFVGALGIERFPGFRRPWLIGSCLSCMGLLFVFKYYNFFLEAYTRVQLWLGLQAYGARVSLVLPVGISFFTFQTVGYLVDVYRRDVRAERNLVDFLLFITFFPQLVAGPIERSRDLTAQIKRARSLEPEDVLYGIYLVSQGYVKKVVIADNLAPTVNMLFSQDGLSGPLVVVGAVAFSFQIYGDFSGYTDIARGVARLLGFRLTPNFLRPYFAANPTLFWRRWHVSLSTWFRDYVYIPMGGGRKGRARTAFNLTATMLLCGLWHGAGLNFVAWGLYHGLLLILHKLYVFLAPRWLRRDAPLYRVLSSAATFLLVSYGWILFRVSDGGAALRHMRAAVTDLADLDVAILTGLQILPFAGLAVAVDALERFALLPQKERVVLGWKLVPCLAGMFALVLQFAALDGGDFIYFRF